jgi:hypothetical protein
MHIFKNSAAVITICALSGGAILGFPQLAKADYQSFSLAPGFTSDQAIGTGLSGGSNFTTDCGYIDAADAPDHVITLTRPFSFLRVGVEAEGDVTLIVTGPDGRYCSDDVNGAMPEISGAWPAGTYEVWVGDWEGNNSSGTYHYQLSFSEQ